MQETNLKGIWIPIEIFTNANLSDKERHIYSLVLFFSKKDGYCTITNKFLANLLNLSDTRVSKLVSSLVKKEYVDVITNYYDTTRQMINRKIIPLVKYDDPIYLKTTTSIDNNDNTTSQKYTSTVVKNDKYINNKKYNNYKGNRRVYTNEFLDSIYANKF